MAFRPFTRCTAAAAAAAAQHHLSTYTCVSLIETHTNIRAQNRTGGKEKKDCAAGGRCTNKQSKIKASLPLCRDATGGGNRGRRVCFEVIFRPNPPFAEQTIFHYAYKSQQTTEGGAARRAQEPTAHTHTISRRIIKNTSQHKPAGFDRL